MEKGFGTVGSVIQVLLLFLEQVLLDTIHITYQTEPAGSTQRVAFTLRLIRYAASNVTTVRVGADTDPNLASRNVDTQNL